MQQYKTFCNCWDASSRYPPSKLRVQHVYRPHNRQKFQSMPYWPASKAEACQTEQGLVLAAYSHEISRLFKLLLACLTTPSEERGASIPSKFTNRTDASLINLLMGRTERKNYAGPYSVQSSHTHTTTGLENMWSAKLCEHAVWSGYWLV